MSAEHPLIRRILWHPSIVAVPTAWFVYRVSQDGFGFARTGGLVTCALWLSLSLYDLVTRHRFLDWLYSPD